MLQLFSEINMFKSTGVAHGTVGTVPTVPIFTAGTENRTKKIKILNKKYASIVCKLPYNKCFTFTSACFLKERKPQYRNQFIDYQLMIN